jgi:hypothetical protein
MAKLTAEKIFAGPLFAMSSAITVSLIADLIGYFPFEENALFAIKPGPLGKVLLGFWCVVSLAVSLRGLSKNEDK